MINKQCSLVVLRCVIAGIASSTPATPYSPMSNDFLRGTLFLRTKIPVVSGCCRAPAVVMIGNATNGDMPRQNKTACINAKRPTPAEVSKPATNNPIKPNN